MSHSVLEAIKAGIWDFEPDAKRETHFNASDSIPGSEEKLHELTRRVELGLPLWHPRDRHTYDGLDVRSD